MKHIIKRAGFTLVETIIYVGIITIIMSAFVVYALNIADVRTRTLVEQEVLANGRFAMNVMTRHIRQLDTLDTVNSVLGSDPGVLEFSTSSTPLFSVRFDLDHDDGTLRIKNGNVSPQALTSVSVRVTQLAFQEIEPVSSARQVLIRMRVEYNADTIDPLYNFSQFFQTSVNIKEL